MRVPAWPYDTMSDATILPVESTPILMSYMCDGPPVVPAVGVPAHPLHAHRLADRRRDHRRLLGRLLHLAAAVGARALVEDRPDLVRRDVHRREEPSQHRADLRGRRAPGTALPCTDRLPGRVDDHGAVLHVHVGDRARRADRHVAVVLVLVGRRHRLRRRRERGVDVADVRREAGRVRACSCRRPCGATTRSCRSPESFGSLFQTTFSWAAAWIASYSFGATTARKLLTWTTCAPGMCLIELSSTLTGKWFCDVSAPCAARTHDARVQHPRDAARCGRTCTCR